jgi:hypothetical protein
MTGFFRILSSAASRENENSVFTKATNILRSTSKLEWDSIGGGKAMEGTYEVERAKN